MNLLQNATNSATCVYRCFPVLSTIDWLEEARLICTALTITLAFFLFFHGLVHLFSRGNHWMQAHSEILRRNDLLTPFLLRNPFSSASEKRQGRRTICCGPTQPVYDSTVRVVLDSEVLIYAWPSRGGVIVLDHADCVDFDFLKLDRLDPPPTRLPNQDEEDNICQKLLMLGAVWYDSEARFRFLRQLGGQDVGAYMSPSRMIDKEMASAPTERENLSVCVAWPSSGGLWVKEWRRGLYGGDVDEEEDDEDMTSDIARLGLCSTMDERCELMKSRVGARWYGNVEEYKGFGCLNAWTWKQAGEVGELETTTYKPEEGKAEKQYV